MWIRLWFLLNRLISLVPYTAGIDITRACVRQLVVWGEPLLAIANHSLVKHGWCWWYRKYAPGDTVLEGLEHEARGTERFVGRSAAGAAVGVAEENPLRQPP